MKKLNFNSFVSNLLGVGVLSLFVSSAYAGSTLSAGIHHVCGIKTDNTLSCWGDNAYNQTQSPEGEFTQISAGYYFNCGLKTDGQVVCWGRDTTGETSPPPGQFIQLDVGGHHACALYADGDPVCWGRNSSGQSSPPPGPFKQLALGNAHSCGLMSNGNVKCWGDNSHEQSKDVADMTYITAGYNTTCGIKSDGVASCWGWQNNSYGYLSQIDFSVYGNGDRSSDYESFLFCGLKSDYSLSCPSSTAAPTGRFTYVTVGGSSDYTNHRKSFACGIRENGLVACWGENLSDRATAPVGIQFKQPTQLPQPEPSATIAEDLSLQIHRMTYKTLTDTQVLWANFKFSGENEQGRMIWELEDYGVVYE